MLKVGVRGSSPRVGFPSALADSLEQVARRSEFQATGEDHDRLETRGALRALQQADLGAVQIAEVGERLLGEADFFAMEAQVGGELFAGGFHSPNFGGPQTEGLQTNGDNPFQTSCPLKTAYFKRKGGPLYMVGTGFEPV